MGKLTMTNQQHVILGTGPLGQSVMRELVQRGAKVRMVNRSGRRGEIPSAVEVVAGDAYNADSVRALTADAAVVYQCAQPEYHEWTTKFRPLQAAIVEGVSAHKGIKLIVGENLYMYGEVDGPIHEGLPYNAHTRKGKIRAEMAEALLAAHRAGKIRVAMARGSDFFGPGVLGSSMGERVFYPVLAGKPAQLAGRLDLPHSMTYIDDFGKALVILGEREEALGQAWHVPNDAPLTQQQFIDLIAKELGTPVKVSAMGKLMMRIGGLFIPPAREMIEMMYEFDQPFVVDSSKFERAFGMKATPIRDAIRATVAWYKAHPHVEEKTA